MNAKKAASKTPRYGEAMEELESILAQLEDESVDVDELTAKVKRASELIQLCRDRLKNTRLEIEQVVADLESIEEAEQAEDDDEEEEPA
jgi:exodeoxyribonuclease VII small subunit